MSRKILRLLTVLAFSSLFPALKADAAPSKPLPLAAQVQENGIVVIYEGQRPVGYVTPELFLQGWKIVFYTQPGRNDRCDSTAKLPDGSRVAYRVSIKAGASTLRIHAVMEPNRDIQFVDNRLCVILPYEDWTGDAYAVGDTKSALSKDIVYKNAGVLGNSDGAILLGPSQKDGLTISAKASKRHGFLQDSRQWTPNLSVYFSERLTGEENRSWKAGAKKSFDCVLSFNRPVAVKLLRPPTDMDALKAQVDELVKPVLEGGWCPGLAVGILLNGKTAVWGYGTTSLKGGKTPDGDTEFEIGSITKLFTKLLFSDQVHQGRMGLDDKAQSYLPASVELPVKDGKEITLLTLSNHTSGLRHDPETWDINKGSSYSRYTLAQLYDYLSHCRLLSAPGEKFSYSNTGVALLGDLVAQRNGSTWEAYVQKRILDPVGMSDTGVRWNASETARAAQGYDGDGAPVERWDWGRSPIIPAGSLHSTVNDLLKLAQAALDQDSSPLADIAFDDTAEKLDWGRQVNHDGGTYGYNTSFHVDRDKKTAVVVLGNTGAGMVSKTAWRVRNLVEGRLSMPVSLPVMADMPPVEMKKIIGTYRIVRVPDGWGPKPDGNTDVVLKEGLLYGHGHGHGWFTDYRIYPLANGDLYIKKDSLEIALTKDSEGNVTGYTAKDYPAYVGEKLDYRKPAGIKGEDIPPPP